MGETPLRPPASTRGSAAGGRVAARLVAGILLLGSPLPLRPAELLVANNPEVLADGGDVLRYDAVTGASLGTLVATASGGLAQPFRMALAANGDVLVFDEEEGVLRYDGESGAFLGQLVAKDAGGLQGPDDLAVGPDGDLYITSNDSDSVERFDGTTGAYDGAFVAGGSGGLDDPRALTFGPGGHLFVSTNAGAVLRYHGTTGAFLGTFVATGSGGLNRPFRILFGPDGHLYAGSVIQPPPNTPPTERQILRFRGSDGAFLGVFVPENQGDPDDFTFGPDGDIYASSFEAGNVILRYRGGDGAPLGVFVAAGSGGLERPGPLLFRNRSDCEIAPGVLCLEGDRFAVEATWRIPAGQTGQGHAVELTDDTGYFWFFDAANVEVIVKVLDACVPGFQRFWVFASGLTNVEVELTVTDTEADEVKVYTNPLNTPFQPLQDTNAFDTCP